MNINIIRGRTVRLSINLTQGGEPYEPVEGETVLLTVKRSIRDDTAVLEKPGPEVVFKPSDTAELDPGTYVYDVTLHKANGDLYTVIPVDGAAGIFSIVRGVHE